jgi:hypothetical protein
VDAPEAVAEVLLALGPQDRLVHVPRRVKLDCSDLHFSCGSHPSSSEKWRRSEI